MDPEQREKLQKKLGIDRRDEQREGLLYILCPLIISTFSWGQKGVLIMSVPIMKGHSILYDI